MQRTTACTTCSKAVHVGLQGRMATPSLVPTAGIMLARASLHALDTSGGPWLSCSQHVWCCCRTDLVHWDDRGIGPSSQDESWHGFTSKRPTPPCSGFVTVDDVSFLCGYVSWSKLTLLCRLLLLLVGGYSLRWFPFVQLCHWSERQREPQCDVECAARASLRAESESDAVGSA